MRQLLRDIAEIGAGQGAPQGDSNYCTDGIPFVKAGNMESLTSGGSLNDILKVSERVARDHKLKLYPKGTVLFAKSGMSCLKGYVYVLPQEAYVVSHLACITPKEDISDYLRFYFDYHRPNQLVKDPAYPSISLADIGALEIDTKDAKSRERIISVLHSVEAIIESRKQQLSNLDDLIKARFVEMFGDPVVNSMNWQMQRFDSLCENLDGKRRPITSTDRIEGPYPYYGASGIVDFVADYIFDEDILLISEDGANLLARSTPIAFSVSGKVWVNNHAHVVRFSNFALQKYIEYYFAMISIEDYVTGSTQPKLNQAKLNGMMIPIPSKDKIEKYLCFIRQIDKSKFM